MVTEEEHERHLPLERASEEREGAVARPGEDSPMLAVRPVRYADVDESTFVEISGLEYWFRYQVEARKRWGLFPQGRWARVSIRAMESDLDLTFEFRLPEDLRVGEELPRIEEGLYRLLEEAHHAARQHRAVALDRLRTSRLAEADAWASAPETGEEAALNLALQEQLQPEGRDWDEVFLERLLLGIRYVTRISSLSLEGYRAFLEGRGSAGAAGERGFSAAEAAVRDEAGERTAGESGVALRPAETAHLLDATVMIVEAEASQQGRLVNAKLRVLDMLDGWSASRGAAPSTELIDLLVDTFTPAYLRALRRHARRRRLPRHPVSFLFRQFILGAMGGALVDAAIADPWLYHVAGGSFPFEGWQVGAALAMLWPYARALYYRFFAAGSELASRSSLRTKAQSALQALPGGDTEEFRARIRRRRRQLLQTRR
jgi:hypothetical protein